MAKPACLHIQDRAWGPIRVMEVPWLTTRIGGAARCEVKLLDQELLGEVCRLERRDGQWRLVATGGEVEIEVNGQIVMGSVAIDLDVPFRVGSSVLTLRSDRASQPDWAMHERQRPTALAGELRGLKPPRLERTAFKAARYRPAAPASSRYTPRTAGALPLGQTRVPRTVKTRPHPVPKPQPPSASLARGTRPEPNLVSEPATPPRSPLPKFDDRLRIASLRTDAPDKATGLSARIQALDLESFDLAGLATGMVKPTPAPSAEVAVEAKVGPEAESASGDDTSRIKTPEQPPADDGPIETCREPAQEAAASGVIEEAAASGVIEQAVASGVIEEASLAPAQGVVEGASRPEEAEPEAEPLVAVEEVIARDQCERRLASETGSTSQLKPLDSGRLTVESETQAQESRGARAEDSGRLTVVLETRAQGSRVGCERERPLAIRRSDERAEADSRARGVRGDSDWPSVRDVMASYQRVSRVGKPASKSRQDRSRSNAERAVELPAPTEIRAPDSLALPASLAGVPLLLLALFLGVGGGVAGWIWAVDSGAAGLTGSWLMVPPEARRGKLPNTALPAGSSWLTTTSRHLALYALAASQDAAPDDPRPDVEPALTVAPLDPTARLLRARLRSIEREASLSEFDLGLPRDSIALATSARRLVDTGRLEPARALYSKAIALAAGHRAAAETPVWSPDPDVQRFLLPGESRVRFILNEMIQATGWKPAEWIPVLPTEPLALVAASRMLAEVDGEQARSLLEQVVKSSESSEAIREAARAEALALLRRYGDAQEAYRRAIAHEPEGAVKRLYWFNLADLARLLDDERGRHAALDRAMAVQTADLVSRRAVAARRSNSASTLGSAGSAQNLYPRAN